MLDSTTVAGMDRDGAIAEAAERLPGDTRAELLKKGAWGGGAFLAGGAALGLPALAAGQRSARQDTEILNFALTLEYLEAAFYAEALQRAGLSGRLRRFAEVAGAHEAAHVALLRSVLGSNAVASPRFDFKGTTSSSRGFTATAIALEDTGVSAYTGQVNRVRSPRVLLTAARIQAVEARHASWIRHIAGEDPAPAALNPKANQKQVLAVVTSTGFIVGAA